MEIIQGYNVNISQFYALLGSKKQCQEEEDRVLDEEAIHICDEDIEMENNESSDSETPEDEGNEDEDKENTDKGTDNAENQNPKRK